MTGHENTVGGVDGGGLDFDQNLSILGQLGDGAFLKLHLLSIIVEDPTFVPFLIHKISYNIMISDILIF